MEIRHFTRWMEIIYRAGSRKRLMLLTAGFILGIFIIGISFAQLVLAFHDRFDVTWLRGNPRLGLVFFVAGGALTLITFLKINERFLIFMSPNSDGVSLLKVVYERMASLDKPRVVVFSNGMGLFILLNALKEHVSGIDVVLPQGEDTQIYGELLQANNLNLQNVYISNIPNGTMCAEFTDGSIVEGLLSIKESRNKPGIRRLFIKPREGEESITDTSKNSEVVEAIKNADAVLFGPTSLFSGVIAAILPPDVSEALRRTHALKIFICPVMTEPGKTDNFSVSDHVTKVEEQGNFSLDYVILNNKRISYTLAEKYYDYGAEQVLLNLDEFEHTYLKVDFSARLGEVRQLNHAVLIDDDLINASVQKILGESDEKLVVRHDPDKLKQVFGKVFDHIEYRRNLTPTSS